MKKSAKLLEPRPSGIGRRARLLLATIATLALAVACSSGSDDSDSGGGEGRYFHFAVLSDTHLIDDYYSDPTDATARDVETIHQTEQRLRKVAGEVAGFSSPIELVFITGDFIHRYPVADEDWDFLMENRTRFDIAAELIEGFGAPVSLALGNNDYGAPAISRDFTNRLFKEKFGVDPYLAIDRRGFKFIVLNNMLGETQDPASAAYSKEIGSLGREQLGWLDEQLAEGKPSFVFVHFPLLVMAESEEGGDGLYPILQQYKENVRLVVSGHFHNWLDYSSAFDPPNLAIGSVREDEDAYLIFKVDTLDSSYEILNWDCLVWNTMEAELCLSAQVF